MVLTLDASLLISFHKVTNYRLLCTDTVDILKELNFPTRTVLSSVGLEISGGQNQYEDVLQHMGIRVRGRQIRKICCFADYLTGRHLTEAKK